MCFCRSFIYTIRVYSNMPARIRVVHLAARHILCGNALLIERYNLHRRRIVLPPVAEPRAEERGLRAQFPIELPRPRFGCTDLFAGEGVDALAADVAQRIYILQRNARRALALVCQGIGSALRLRARLLRSPLRRPPAGFGYRLPIRSIVNFPFHFLRNG